MGKVDDIEELFTKLHTKRGILEEKFQNLNEEMKRLDEEYFHALLSSGKAFEKEEALCENCGSSVTVDGIDLFHQGSNVKIALHSDVTGKHLFVLHSCKNCNKSEDKNGN